MVKHSYIGMLAIVGRQPRGVKHFDDTTGALLMSSSRTFLSFQLEALQHYIINSIPPPSSPCLTLASLCPFELVYSRYFM